MNPAPRIAIVVVILAAVAAGGFFLWRRQQAGAPAAALAPPPPPIAAPAPASTPAAPPAAPPIRHPLAAGPQDGLPGLDDADGYIKNAITRLLGRKSALSSLIFDGFARRFVATVNNLATDSAASQLWPVTRTEGRFQADLEGSGGAISAANAARYTPFVTLVDGVSTAGAVALYLRLYPLFQKAYEDLGTPGHDFNDRVLEVIDNLLATPAVAGPIKVKLVQVDGSGPGPGRLYLFDDAVLESSSAGQKILLRMGADNARKLKAKLADVRKRLVEVPR